MSIDDELLQKSIEILNKRWNCGLYRKRKNIY
jgi:hypothetical protein